jgi:hypothetical protein
LASMARGMSRLEKRYLLIGYARSVRYFVGQAAQATTQDDGYARLQQAVLIDGRQGRLNLRCQRPNITTGRYSQGSALTGVRMFNRLLQCF